MEKDDMPLLYFSYAILTGEQGVYVSQDTGTTWKKVTINPPTGLMSLYFRWHPTCGDNWVKILEKLKIMEPFMTVQQCCIVH